MEIFKFCLVSELSIICGNCYIFIKDFDHKDISLDRMVIIQGYFFPNGLNCYDTFGIGYHFAIL